MIGFPDYLLIVRKLWLFMMITEMFFAAALLIQWLLFLLCSILLPIVDTSQNLALSLVLGMMFSCFSYVWVIQGKVEEW